MEQMQGDLISRSTLIESLKVHFEALYREDRELLSSDHVCISEDVEDLIKMVQEQPTAYDVEAVKDTLEKRRVEYEVAAQKCSGMQNTYYLGLMRGYEYSREVVCDGMKEEGP